MSVKPEEKVVVFADLLGFATLTENYELDVPTLRSSDRLDTIFGTAFKPNPLTRAFTEFHRAMRWALRISQLKHSSTAITFSDSAFVATARLHEAVGIGVYLMKSLLRSGVPIRMGIASGSFEAVRFRSDITSDGGRKQVAVAPITHSPPHDPNVAVEIPHRVKEYLGLDSERSWVILEEVNIFTWPGFDLRPIKKGESRVDYGLLPPKLFERLIAKFRELRVQGKVAGAFREPAEPVKSSQGSKR